MQLTNRPTNVTLKGLITRVLGTVLHVNIRIQISLRVSDIITLLYIVISSVFVSVSCFAFWLVDNGR